VLLLVAMGAIAFANGELGDWVPRTVPVLLYVENWAYLVGYFNQELAHTWSLSIEEQFYLVWPLLLLVLARTRWLLVGTIGLVAGSVLVTLPDFPGMGVAYYGSPERAKELLAGCLVAIVAFRIGRDLRPWTPIAALAGAILLASCFVPGMGHIGTLVYFVPAAVVVAWAAAHPTFAAWRPVTGTGRISYGLYLYHYPLIGLAAWPVLMAATFAFAVASWFLVERPMVRRRPVTDPQAEPESRPVLGPLVLPKAGLAPNQP
jgi:peptidoglycan/LPS O-acetylase OafA/YrhL